MSELDANVIVNGQKAIATVAQTGTVIEDGGAIDATSVIQTESGLQKVVKTYSIGGGGGGGTSDYTDLSNKPQINSVTLTGNKTSSDLHLQAETSVVTLTTTSVELASNTIYNGSELASVTFTLPDTVNADFIAQLNFTSGTTATVLTAPNTINFEGDDCSGGTFTPVASKRYQVLITSDGVNVNGYVIGR